MIMGKETEIKRNMSSKAASGHPRQKEKLGTEGKSGRFDKEENSHWRSTFHSSQWLEFTL